jgi:hypothetical protein
LNTFAKPLFAILFFLTFGLPFVLQLLRRPGGEFLQRRQAVHHPIHAHPAGRRRAESPARQARQGFFGGSGDLAKLVDLQGPAAGRIGGGQRMARLSQVQGGGVAVVDGFFAGAGGVDGFEGQGDFDEFFAEGGHGRVTGE